MRIGCAGVCAVLLATGAAGEVNLKWIPAETQWLIELDMRALASSTAAGRLREQWTALGGTGVLSRLDQITQATGIDMHRDLWSLALYGGALGEPSGGAIVRGRWDAARITSHLERQRAFKRLPYGDKTILGWIDGTPLFACLASRDLAVFALDEASMKRALDTLAGRRPGLAQTPAFAGFNQLGQAPLVRFLAGGVGRLAEADPRAALLQQAETASLTVSETPGNGTLRLAGALGMLNAEAATQLVMMLQGLQAMAQMQSQTEPALAGLAGAVQVSAAGRNVDLRAALGPAVLQALAKQLLGMPL